MKYKKEFLPRLIDFWNSRHREQIDYPKEKNRNG